MYCPHVCLSAKLLLYGPVQHALTECGSSSGELVKTWRARYFVLRSGSSPLITYFRAIEVTCYETVPAEVQDHRDQRRFASVVYAAFLMSTLMQTGEGPDGTWRLEGCRVHVSLGLRHL